MPAKREVESLTGLSQILQAVMLQAKVHLTREKTADLNSLAGVWKGSFDKVGPSGRVTMTQSLIAAILAVSLFLCQSALAWSSAGHMTIAAEAYRQLTPELQGKVTEILKSHPDYSKWEASFNRSTPGVDLRIFVFMRASTWPDEIRNHHNRYDHPHWHYIDYPLKPPSFSLEPAPSPDDDALYGIAQSEKALADSKASPEIRAVYLSWLIHLIGDLHQPLHCASLVDRTYPNGDKGGNDFYVKPGTRGIKLHALWDGLLGTSGKPQSRLNYAVQIEAEYPKGSLPELSKAKTAKEWSLESRQVAVEKVYLRGELKGSRSPDSPSDVPSGYTKAAKAVAERQAALAGYRLADEIRRCVR